LGQSSKGFKPGMELEFDGGLTATVLTAPGGGEYQVKFTSPMETLEAAIERAGRLPLPPYITRDVEGADAERYQTIYARKQGSVAAPTAGLHFTERVFKDLDARGVKRAFVTLDVGPGTFLPVREGPVSEHKMHAERAHVPEETVKAIADAKRVIAVGTTVVRTLESHSVLSERSRGQGQPSSSGDSVPSTPLGRNGSFSTDIFITPGFEFRVIDAMVTNFHLPKSTLVMLVSAFLGREQTLAAYAEAVREQYRFFSYGDAMFIEAD
ncbi:MAG TPA: tRNA preQ1(34) S-adenosylmethionine ribosyltransferase-isomerase QueA, partial [Archangium sp.]